MPVPIPDKPACAFSLHVDPAELNLDCTFSSGQAFRWQQLAPQDWQGPVGPEFIRMVQSDDHVDVYSVSADIDPATVRAYLRLDVTLSLIGGEMARADPRILSISRTYPGLRILAQDPVECLLTFVCAVATNIPRIQWSIRELCAKFGCRRAGGAYGFPALDALASAQPEDLRVGGMEFRCRSLSQAARALKQRGGLAFLNGLRGRPYEEAAAELIKLPSVGRKVADCALLFSLGHDDAFPLDTHTWRVIEDMYGLGGHSRTDKAYRLASAELRAKLGPHAGWMQQYLYVHAIRNRTRPGT